MENIFYEEVIEHIYIQSCNVVAKSISFCFLVSHLNKKMSRYSSVKGFECTELVNSFLKKSSFQEEGRLLILTHTFLTFIKGYLL